MADPLEWLRNDLADWTSRGLRRTLKTRATPQRAEITINDRALMNFGSNDYLGLAADQRLIAAAHRAAVEEGWGAGASPLITGHSSSHKKLEQELASWMGTEAALVFSSGFAANSATIPALVEARDAIFSDSRNHASIIDGCRLSRATTHIYHHSDTQDLEQLLEKHAPSARRKLIVTDSVFSMDGDIAPLAEIADLAERFECMLMVDEAHAIGIFGTRGSGCAEAERLTSKIHVRVGTLSKSLGSAGGFVAGSQSLVDWLVNRARGYVFSTAHPAAAAAAATTAIQIVKSEPQRRKSLLDNAKWFTDQLIAQGWNVGTSSKTNDRQKQSSRKTSQIVPIILGEPNRVMHTSMQLRELGFLVPGIRPPSVPEGESLLRISLSYSHSRNQLEELLSALQHFR
jgi:8-amino-7-oxononanoate synthase